MPTYKKYLPLFPTLFCGDVYLVKSNGNPYISPLKNGYWHFLMSTSENPLLIMLEFIWTKLSREFSINMPWGDNLEIENFNKFLSARPVLQEGIVNGWMLNYIEADKETLKKRRNPIKWEPVELNITQFVIISRLCIGHRLFIDDPSFIEDIKNQGYNPEEFIQNLIETVLVALDGKELKLITEKCQCAIDSQGRFVAGEDIDGRFTQWILN